MKQNNQNIEKIKKFIELSDDDYMLSQEDEAVLNLIRSKKIKKQEGLDLIYKAYKDTTSSRLNQNTQEKVFDPFGSYERSGYLENVFAEKNLDVVKKMEQAVFYLNFDVVAKNLKKFKIISASQIYLIHQILFIDLYPWAGKTRYLLSSMDKSMEVRKGTVEFLTPYMIDTSINMLTPRINDSQYLKKNLGQSIGDIAYIHPFLDGNGRTMLTLFDELARRCHLSINWSEMKRHEYLDALTQEINSPGSGAMNKYMKEFVL